MVDHIFREYDIRGIVGTQFYLDQVYQLTQAIVVFLKQQNPLLTTVALGMDGRVHSQTIKQEMTRALVDSGIAVLFLGVCPTPVLYFSMVTQPVQAGLMITASHNPAEYNGIKICCAQDSVWGKQIMHIRDLYKQGAAFNAQTPGSYTEIDAVTLYINYLAKRFAHLRGIHLGLIIDCANAVGGVVMPRLIQKLDWKNARCLYAELDGTYPNHEADPVVEHNMRTVKKELAEDPRLSLGIGLDGDCDRMAPMTKSGYLVPGDQLLALWSRPIIAQNPGVAVVFDVKASTVLIELLQQWGARACISPCGHSIIKNEMKKQGALLGGELSCHFFFKDRYFGYDDGIYAALRLVELLMQTGKNLDELVATLPRRVNSPEIRLHCAEEQKRMVVNSVKKMFEQRADAHLITIDGVRVATLYGWGLVRASNTQAAVSLRFEADTEENLVRIKKDFFSALLPFFDQQVLVKQLQLT